MQISKTVRDIRVNWAIGDRERDKGLATPDEIRRFDDISYGPHGQANMLDVYVRKDAEGLQPTIVNVHGGGWVYGNKEIYQHYCMRLALRGFAVVNINYRLAPENRFPAAVEDINAAMQLKLRYILPGIASRRTHDDRHALVDAFPRFIQQMPIGQHMTGQRKLLARRTKDPAQNLLAVRAAQAHNSNAALSGSRCQRRNGIVHVPLATCLQYSAQERPSPQSHASAAMRNARGSASETPCFSPNCFASRTNFSAA